MRQLLVLAAIAGLAVAKPETYREKEDFQFSRSSSDEGSKAGYYGAQRGNMGGNYERAHNMDSLAQNQMSGLVRTVEGELGDGAKQHTGSVYTAAKSSGVYGSGLYDLSNLEGRNFHEGSSHGESHSHSALASQHSSGYRNQQSASNTGRYSNAQILNAGFDSTRAHDGGYASILPASSQNAGYNDYGTSHSRGSGYGRYNNAANSDQALYSTSHQGSNLESASQYQDRNTASQNSGHYSQAAGYQSQVYDQGSALSRGSNIHSRVYPSGTPVKIVIRPGTRVSVPVAAQTYDASQSSSSFDQNAINSNTELLNSNDQVIVSKPNVKNYESSYSYRKEWEKHDNKPVSGAGVMPLAIPTINPYPVNSELYEDAQSLISQQQQRNSGMSSQSQHSSHSGYNSASSNQYNTQHHTGSNSGIKAYQGAYNGGATGASSAYNHGASGSYVGANNGASNLNLVDDASTKPKSYQSAYSYHKSWERQGDPYVIVPTTNGDYEQISGKLTAGSLNQGAYGSHQYGSHSQQHSHQGYNSHSGDDCDENAHIRRVRSPNTEKIEDLGQHTHNAWQQFGQQTQKQRDELGQQTSDAWQQFGQRTQKQREELGQHTHDAWQQFGHDSQKQKDKLEDFGHQTQNSWDLFGQQTQKQREELGQRTHDRWQQFGQQTQNQREGLGQEIHDTWQQFGQQTQNQREGLGQEIHDTWQQLGQHTQTHKDYLEDFGHHTQNTWDQLSQQTQKQGEELGQRTDNAWHGHETGNKWDKLVDNGQQTLRRWGNQLDDLGQQTHNQWSQMGQQIRETRSSKWDKLEDLGQQTQNTWGQFDEESQKQLEDLGQETQNIGEQFGQQTETKWHKVQNEGQQEQRQWGHDFEGLGQHAHSTWDQFGQQTQNTWDKLEPQSPADLGQQTQDSWTGQEIYLSSNNDRLTEQKPSGYDASSHHYHGMNFDHQSSDNTFEIMNSNNDERHVTQSHTLEKDNTNKTHHVRTIWDEIKKEEIGQENEDTVEDLPQTVDLGQQTQVTWDNINQKENRPWYQDTVETAYKAHHDLTNSEPNNQDNTFVTPNPHPWMYNQVYHNHAHHNESASSNQFLAHHSSSSSQSHRWEGHSTNTNADSNAQMHSTGSSFGSSITSLWDKLGDIEKHSIPSHENDQHKSIADIFGAQTQQNENTDKSNSSKSQTTHNVFDIQTRPVQNNAVSNKSTTSVPNIQAINKIIPSDVERGDITEVINENEPSDVGRGDIGPENSNEQSKPDQSKAYKTPEEIDSLSLTKETNKTSNTNVEQSKNSEDDRNLRVMSLDQQRPAKEESDSKVKITSTTQRYNQINHKPHNAGENHRQEQPFENQDQQNFDQQAFNNQFTFGQETEQQNTDQQTFSNQFSFGQETEPQQNTDQQVVDFGQQSENFGFNQMESQATGSFHRAKAEDLSQQSEQFDQVSLSGWQPEETLSQKETRDNENLEQQSQTGWTENIEDQQVQTAWQPETENLQQQSQQTETFSQPMEDLSQQVQNIGHGVTFHQRNNEHKTEVLNQQNKQFDQVSLSGFKPDEDQNEHQVNWGQGSDDFGQQSQSGWTETMEDQQVQTALKPEDLQQQSQLTHTFAESMENLDQQVQTAWKPTEDLQQQSQLTHKFTESMENLDQQVQTAWKPTEELQQQSQLTHKFTESMENLDQQVQTAWKPTEDLQQQSQLTHKFTESMENLDQQVQTAWKPTEELQQQSQLTHKFTESMENLDQQVQTAWKPTEELQQQSQLTDTFSQMEQNIPPTSNHKQEVSEELIVPQKVATVDSPPEVEVTEKPGFWKSVGNKFTNAKDKVSSWFSRT